VLYCSDVHVVHGSAAVVRAGPGDSIALMGFAVQCGVHVYLFVPPKDATRPASNCAYRSVQLMGAAASRKAPALYLTIANGHFSALTNPKTKFTKADKCFALSELMDEGFDPATGGVVITEDQLEAGILEDLKSLADIGSDVRRIMSLTLSVREADVSDTEVERCKEVLQLMRQLSVAEDIIMTTERGEHEEHLHMQAMLHGPFKLRKEMSKAMKEVFVKKQCFERAFTCCVRVHKPSESISWKSMAGCAALYNRFSCSQ
jgi:hypothetical protein